MVSLAQRATEAHAEHKHTHTRTHPVDSDAQRKGESVLEGHQRHAEEAGVQENLRS